MSVPRLRLAHLLMPLCLALACAPRMAEIRMDPMEIVAAKTDDGLVVEVMDPEALFDEGVRAFEQKQFPEAARKFSLILTRFASSRFAPPALFNRGLVFLADGRPREAARDFERYLAEHPDDPEPADVWQRLGEACSESGDWVRAETALRRRMANWPMTLLQEAEVRARLVRSLRMQGRIDEAMAEAVRIMALHEKNREAPEMDGNWFVAMAAMEVAQIHHDLFGRIKFVLPIERMEKDLVEKASLFLKAQSEYLRTVRLRNPYWGLTAGVKIGRLYEDFYDDVMHAEIPADLSTEDLVLYEAELKKQVRPLIAKAVNAYERNMALARAYGATEEWTIETEARLGRLKRILDEIPPQPESP